MVPHLTLETRFTQWHSQSESTALGFPGTATHCVSSPSPLEPFQEVRAKQSVSSTFSRRSNGPRNKGEGQLTQQVDVQKVSSVLLLWECHWVCIPFITQHCAGAVEAKVTPAAYAFKQALIFVLLESCFPPLLLQILLEQESAGSWESVHKKNR